MGRRGMAELIERTCTHAQRFAEGLRSAGFEVLNDVGLEDAERVAKCLRRAGADGSNPKPKLERALHGRLESPAEPRTLGKKCSSTDLVAWAITRSLTALIRHDPFTRLGHDPEELHLARVAIRRLRSDLRTVAPILDGDWVASVRSELGWIADALGAVRDLDVLRERFVGQIGVLDSGDLAGFEALLAELHSQWSEARRKLLVALDSSRYVDLLDRLEFASRTPDFIVDGDRGSSARDVLVRVCRATWKRVVKTVDDCGSTSWDDVPEVRLHAIRRRVKHARYGAELATAVVGKRASRHARALSRLQDDLGELQDSAVASAWLHDQGRTTSDPAVAFVAGLHDRPDKALFAPGVERLSGKEGGDGEGAALHFAALHREVDISAGVVTGDDGEFRADRLFQELWKVIGR